MSHIYSLFNFFSFSFYPYKNSTVLPRYPYKLVFFKRLDFFFFKFFKLSNFFFRINFRLGSKNALDTFLLGFFFFWKHIKFWILPLLIIVVVIYFSIFVRTIPFFKVSLEWFLVLNIFYWLISGFVFFIKKYKYNRYTSAIQRFWRRSFILFWLIETSLFVVFIYLLFNSSQEPAFAFDMIQLTKLRLYSWKFFLFKAFFVFIIIIMVYTLLVCAKWNTFNKLCNFFFLITILLTYVVWLEFYQFFYVLNWYGEIVWLFDLDDKTWYAENIFKRSRIVNHYVTICVIAKFWHIVFIYIFWIFFVLRTLEQGSVSYLLLSANFQNFLILYIMNWLLMYPWFKFLFRKFLTVNHKSFYEFREFLISGFFCDFTLFFKNCIYFPKFPKIFSKKNFFYSSNNFNGQFESSKNFIKQQVSEIFLFINIDVFSHIFFPLTFFFLLGFFFL
jgi:hypothetical protein